MLHPYSVLVGKKHYVYNDLIGNWIYYHINDYLQILSLARYIYMVPVILNMTRWKSSSADRICRMYGCKANTGFTVRCLMQDQPEIFNFTLFIISIMWFAQAVRVCEAPIARVDKNMNHHNFINACWSVILTMTTVGFGDYFPRTTIGRIIIFFCAMFGVVVVSMIVVTVMNMLEMSDAESKAFTVSKKITLRKAMTQDSGVILGKFMSLNWKIKKKLPINSSVIFDFIKSVTTFTASHRDYRNEVHENQNEYIFSQFNMLKFKNDELKVYMSVMANGLKQMMDKKKIIFKEQEDKQIMKVLANSHKVDEN